MENILEPSLPNDFYKKDGWVETMVAHYNGRSKITSKEIIQKPIEILTESLSCVFEVMSARSDIIHNALGQTIEPLFHPDEYEKEIYDYLQSEAERLNSKELSKYAEALFAIRKLFQIDEDFYESNFKSEIETIEGEDYQEKYDIFTKEIQNITKIHINQIKKMVEYKKD